MRFIMTTTLILLSTAWLACPAEPLNKDQCSDDYQVTSARPVQPAQRVAYEQPEP